MVAIECKDVPATREQCILHHNAEPFEGWHRKLQYLLGASSIPGVLRGLLKEQFEAGDEPALRASYNKFFGLTLEQASQMNEIGSHFVLTARVTRFVNTYFPPDTE